MVKVYNMGHSGFTVELDSLVLVFDYYEGLFPALPPKKKVCVFISHRHPDHFNPAVFSLCADHPDVHYYISDDIYESRISDKAAGKYTLVHPGDDLRITTRFRVKALPSTDCGVAFLVFVNGRNFFHAGDLNLWLWDTMTEAEAFTMTKRFREYTAQIGSIAIDTAFLPLDTRQGIYSFLGFDYYMKHFKIRRAIPMHFFGSSRISRDLIDSPISRDYREKIITLDPGTNTELRD